MVATTDAPLRTLIVNADDFGMSAGINRGILEAVAAGTVTSVSLMVGMPASDDAIEAATRLGDALGVGLHLTLTVGRPLTRAESLVDRITGEFLSAAQLLRRALTGGVHSADVYAECRAQIQRARRTGLTLTHLDGHQHVHLFPVVTDAVRQAVIAEGIAVVRRPSEPLLGGPLATRRLPHRLLIEILAARARLERWPVRTTDRFMGGRLLGASDFEAGLIAAFDVLSPGTTEIMVHPGYARAPLPGNDPYVFQREVELRALLSARVRARLSREDIALTHFGFSHRAH